jgi:phytoene synthase
VTTPDLSLDAEVRRVDEDRWLASRFAPTEVRVRLIAIYALNHEIARTAEIVTQPAIGDIRLAWWREAIAEIHAGKPARVHPVLQAYAPVAAGLPAALWDAMIDARGKDLDAAPFATWDDVDGYLDATAGGVMRIALAACGASVSEILITSAARAWGYVGLLRAAAHWRARGRRLLPEAGGSEADMLGRARVSYEEARKQTIPSEAFPALGYVTLVRGYFGALAKQRTTTQLLTRQLSLIAASATGRL